MIVLLYSVGTVGWRDEPDQPNQVCDQVVTRWKRGADYVRVQVQRRIPKGALKAALGRGWAHFSFSQVISNPLSCPVLSCRPVLSSESEPPSLEVPLFCRARAPASQLHDSLKP